DDPDLLASSLDDSSEVDPPALHAGEAHLGERDSHFAGPALIVAMRLALPHAVPGVVVPPVVEERAVVERAGRADLEVIAAAPVTVGIDEQAKLVAWNGDVAPREARDDGVGCRIEHARSDVERVVVVGDAHLGLHRGRRPLDRIALLEV